jgi:hypothetical protein
MNGAPPGFRADETGRPAGRGGGQMAERAVAAVATLTAEEWGIGTGNGRAAAGCRPGLAGWPGGHADAA